MSVPLSDFPIDQVITPALGEVIAEVMRERARAIVQFGHDAAADDAKGLDAIGGMARAFMQIATERASGPPERRTLPGARVKAVQALALGLAFIDAIDREIAREGGTA